MLACMKQQRRLIKLMFLFGGLCVSLWQGAPYVDALFSAHDHAPKAPGQSGQQPVAPGLANLAALQALGALGAGATPQSPAGVSQQASSLLAQLGLVGAGQAAAPGTPALQPTKDEELVLYAADGRRLTAHEAAALRAEALRNRPKIKTQPSGPGAKGPVRPKGPSPATRAD